MKFTSTLITLVALFSVAIASPAAPATDVQVVRENVYYDNPSESLNNVACSNGPNGLVTKGYKTFDSLPTFPYIGAVYAVHNWGSPECGSCWQLTYEDTGVTIYVTAIDTVGSGFDLSEEAVETLTEGIAGPSFTSINVDSTEVDPSYCGL
ncbi:Cerato-platanin domain containing protein [Lactarius tabidus]|jgi:hypothetical protein